MVPITLYDDCDTYYRFLLINPCTYNLKMYATNPLEKVLNLNKSAATLANEGRLDEATQELRNALFLNPTFTATHHNLGAILIMQGRLDAALECYLRVINSEPKSVIAHFNLANIYRSQGNTNKALFHLKLVIKLDPNHHSAGHLLSATSGDHSERAPVNYVKQLFDQYSSTFEKKLCSELNYLTPSFLNSMAIEILGKDLRFKNALDLGCGTGLAGIDFHGRCSNLVGIDLSPKMLEQCNKKEIYNALFCEDIEKFLKSTSLKFDLFIASDVLNYIGNLRPVFKNVKRCSEGMSYIVFSIESLNGDGFALNHSGRFAHSVAYIQKTIAEFNFKVLEHRSIVLRNENNESVQGDIFILQLSI
jgi:predicted TPR repeat methyltransferase